MTKDVMVLGVYSDYDNRVSQINAQALLVKTLSSMRRLNNS